MNKIDIPTPQVVDKAVFLDFDGVLFDTLREAYCVSTLAMDRQRLDCKVNFNSEHFEIFKKYRFLITDARDYLFLLKSIEKKIKNKKINIRKEFEFQSNLEPEEQLLFKRAFFKTRRFIKKNSYKYWLSLSRPYKFLHYISNLIKHKRNNFFIITTRDKDSVIRLLNINNISFLKKNIYGQEFYKKFDTKGGIVEFLQNKYRIKKSIMVDDSKKHLLSCNNISGLTTCLVGWGYSSRNDKGCTRNEIISKIKKLLGT